ncbi:mental retardation GTPase activating protein homolog 4 isoform X2 [Aethina tumida]|uniref:mental retardation GTPase activating protein homolog 4 isoform X2 n=1 Tax=Aethina tumida TaxID=116153 RepID=UPI002148CB62|nr:mental retardation GTPase activating protein homolog 4 isoform X2 [Aethina tumida]
MAPSELTLEQIHRFFLDNNGVCKNRDVVSAFKPYLTDPHTKEDARNRFRQYINMLAHTKKGENDEKYLVLKSKYANSLDVSSPPSPVTPSHRDPRNSIGLPPSPYDFGSPVRGSPRQPPPYRPPPPVTPSPSHSVDNISITGSLDGTPLAPPRRRSVDKIKIERTKSMEDRDGNVENSVTDDPVTPKRGIGVLAERDTNVEEKENMSVREKTQKFNRLASCEDELSSPKTPKSAEKKKKGVDEDDSASIPMEPKKLVEWFVTASKGEYHELVKLAAADRRLVKKKDPFTVR